MRPNHPSRGATLIEAMISMAVLMIGASGLAAMHRNSTMVMGDAQRLTRASVIARDMITQMETWDFTDVRFTNSNPGNDDDLGDSRSLFVTEVSPPFDHGEANLSAGTGWTGLPTTYLTDAGMERYFNVAYKDDANGNNVYDAVRVAVIVRWPQGGTFRRVVIPYVKMNPGDVQ